jgi:hypothetical protein
MKYVIALLTLGFCSVAANADWIDEFTGGTPQQVWTFGGLPNNNFTPSYSASNNGYLQLSSSVGVGDGPAAIFGFVATESFSPQVSVRTSLNPNGSALLTRDIGVLAHLNPGTLTGYAFTIDYQAGNIDLTRINAGGATQGLSSGSITGFSNTTSYDLQLTVSNGNLVGQVFNSSGSLLTSIQAADTTYSSGFAGIVASRDVTDPTLLGTFGRVTAVPEPGSLLTVLSVVGAFALANRYRRNRALVRL